MRLAVCAIAILSVTLAMSPGSAQSRLCTEVEKRLNQCPVSGYIDNNEAVLSGNASSQGSSDQPGSASSDGARGTPDPTAPPAPAPPECAWDDITCDGRDSFDAFVVTLVDIARFRPTPAQQRMQPDGWVVVGLPANIYAIVDPQIVPGTLLDAPADVRFTPIAYRWDYGDGSSATLTTKGGTWAALGLREFDATPTSHIYRAAGSYTIRLSVSYRAEYRIDGGTFVPIVGTITLPANELYITAGGAKTVLVDRDCTVAPAGPGC